MRVVLALSDSDDNSSSVTQPDSFCTSRRIFPEAFLTSWLGCETVGTTDLRISFTLNGPLDFDAIPKELTNL